MIRKIVQSGDPQLRLVSKPVQKVDKKILDLVQDLKDTLVIQKDPEGVGLAAPQIGKNLRLFVMVDGKNPLKTVINPEVISGYPVTKLSSYQDNKELKNGKTEKLKNGSQPTTHNSQPTTKNIMEGCLSLPHYYGPLKRNFSITIKYLNEKGEPVTETFSGFPAQIVSHEIDHLNGVLFIDRLLEQKKLLFKLVNDEWEEVEI